MDARQLLTLLLLLLSAHLLLPGITIHIADVVTSLAIIPLILMMSVELQFGFRNNKYNKLFVSFKLEKKILSCNKSTAAFTV